MTPPSVDGAIIEPFQPVREDGRTTIYQKGCVMDPFGCALHFNEILLVVFLYDTSR